MRKIAPVVVALAASSWSAWTSLPTTFPGPIWGISVLSKGWTGLCNGAPYVSSDRGRTWTVASHGLPSDVAPGMHGIALPPASTLRIARLTGPTVTRAIAVPPLR